MNTVVIIGAGASGMAAAITASRDENNKIIVLERQQRVGRKLLSTGNGRCNLTNVNAAPEHYHGASQGFADDILKSFTPNDTLKFFASLGLASSVEYGGRVYPLSNSANSVVDVLRFALERPNIDLRTSCSAKKIERRGQGFTVVTDSERINCDYVIVSCGGTAGGKVGGVRDGYDLLAPLGHRCTRITPSLVQIVTGTAYPRALKGVRVNAALRLERGGKTVAESAGELQFTDNGISGPAAFDISRAAAENVTGDIHIDLLGGSDVDVLSCLRRRVKALPKHGAEDALTGIVHNRLGKMIVKYAGVSPAKPLGELHENELRAIASACRDFVLPLRGTESFDKAQVTAGGIDTRKVDQKTLESKIVPGLFITGELLDVDGDCGGYNLQWAWASGVTAGRFGK